MRNRAKKSGIPFYQPLHKAIDFWIGVLVGVGAAILFFLTFFRLS